MKTEWTINEYGTAEAIVAGWKVTRFASCVDVYGERWPEVRHGPEFTVTVEQVEIRHRVASGGQYGCSSTEEVTVPTAVLAVAIRMATEIPVMAQSIAPRSQTMKHPDPALRDARLKDLSDLLHQTLARQLLSADLMGNLAASIRVHFIDDVDVWDDPPCRQIMNDLLEDLGEDPFEVRPVGDYGTTREDVGEVFGLTGGELEQKPWARKPYWYRGPPDFSEHVMGNNAAAILKCHPTDVELRTACECRVFGSDPVPDGWREIAWFGSSGESVDLERGVTIHLGDGWGEAVYARRYPEAQDD